MISGWELLIGVRLSCKEDVESQAALTGVAAKLVDAVTTTLGQKK